MKLSDSVVGAGFIVAGTLTIAATLDYPSGPGGTLGPSLFPRVVAGLIIVLGSVVAVRGIRSRDLSDEVDFRRLHRNPSFVNALVVLGGVIAFIFFVEWLGFLIMASLVTFVIMWRLKVPPRRALLVAIVFTVATYSIFVKFLRVPLPLGILWW